MIQLWGMILFFERSRLKRPSHLKITSMRSVPIKNLTMNQQKPGQPADCFRLPTCRSYPQQWRSHGSQMELGVKICGARESASHSIEWKRRSQGMTVPVTTKQFWELNSCLSQWWHGTYLRRPSQRESTQSNHSKDATLVNERRDSLVRRYQRWQKMHSYSVL